MTLEKLPRRQRRADRAAERHAAPKATTAKAEPIEEKTPVQHQAEIQHAAGAADADGKPKTAVEYWDYAEKYIDAPKPQGIKGDVHADNLEARWDGERDWRDELGVPMKRRSEIEAKLADRCHALRMDD